MPRNDERIGTQLVSTDDALPVIEQQQEEKKELFFPSPTTFVELPSKGRFYPEGHPVQGKKELEIKFMTTREEDLLTNKSLLKKGIAIDKMLNSLLLDKSINLDSLLIGDKNALVIDARISGYGSDYKTKMSCPSCGESQEVDFDLEQSKKINYGEEVDIQEVSLTENGFEAVLPRCKMKVECRFLLGQDEKELAYIAEKKKKNNLAETMMTDQMKTFIVSVNGNSDKKAISTLVENMPAIDSRWLRSVYKKVSPNLELISMFSCKSCDYSEEVSVPLSTSFFWPQS